MDFLKLYLKSQHIQNKQCEPRTLHGLHVHKNKYCEDKKIVTIRQRREGMDKKEIWPKMLFSLSQLQNPQTKLSR